MHLKEVDANLLVTLDALLVDASVTRAAERLGRSASAISHALAKLRELFDVRPGS
jgi:DNA-binding transcriptional LysR family regulator